MVTGFYCGVDIMTYEEFGRNVKSMFAAAAHCIQKRTENEVKKAMIAPVQKRKRAHDDFHKFVRSL